MRRQRETAAIGGWLIALMVWVLTACTVCDATPTPEVPTPAPCPTDAAPRNKLGVHLLLDDGRDAWPVDVWPAHVAYARQAVGEWGYVTQLVWMDDLDPAHWQVFMDLCAEYHLTPIVRLATVYDRRADWWDKPPQDSDGTYRTIASRYAEFIAAMRWPTDTHYVVVGNEPNHGVEWGGRPDPEAYARFLIDVADALHAADASAYVLNAGFDPYSPHTGSQPFVDGRYYYDEETFLDQMVAAYPDVFVRLDGWASHSYPMGPFIEGPWVQANQADLLNDAANPSHIEPPPGINNRGVNSYRWELYKLSTFGVGSLPVFVTETGWRHSGAGEGESYPDPEVVAAYVDLALEGNGGRYPEYPAEGWTPWLEDSCVRGVTFFALDGHPDQWAHTNWLVVDEEGDVTGTYAPFDLLAAQYAQP